MKCVFQLFGWIGFFACCVLVNVVSAQEERAELLQLRDALERLERENVALKSQLKEEQELRLASERQLHDEAAMALNMLSQSAQTLVKSPDPDLRMLAITMMGASERSIQANLPLLRELANDPNEFVRQTASAVMRRAEGTRERQITPDEQAAVAALKSFGARVATNGGGHLRYLDASNLASRFTDSEMQLLKGARHVEVLNLSLTGVSDAGLNPIVDMSALQIIMVPNGVTDKGLENLRDLSNLRALYLGASKVSDDGLAVIGSLPALEVLVLTRSMEIQGSGLVHLSGCRKLEKLSLPGSVADIELKHLVNLSGLRVLGLDDGYTDAAIHHIKACKNLSDLYLRKTKISEAGIRELSASLPDLMIHRVP